MENRDRILQAAARVYAETGFRGATTRRIAAEAGVNEVTLFRIFGSKQALLDEVVRCCAASVPVGELPEVPTDPEAELARWCEAHLEHLRASRSLIRKMMGEVEERPELGERAGVAPTCATRDLHGYLSRLQRAGLASTAVHAPAAVAMLMGALFADGMMREMMPAVFPQPKEAAPRRYARLFLRAVEPRGDEATPVVQSKVKSGVKPGVQSDLKPPAPRRRGARS